MVWPLPENDRFEVRSRADGCGRGVFSRRRLDAGTHILTTSGHLSPIAHVVLRAYRKEVCAWCFAYDRGREWKTRRHGVAFCTSDQCYDRWLEQNGSRLRLYEDVGRALQQRQKRPGKTTNSSARPVDPDIVNFLLSDSGSESLMALVADADVFRAPSSELIAVVPEADYVRAHELLVRVGAVDGDDAAAADRWRELVARAAHNAFALRPTNDGDQSGEFLGYGVWPEASFFNHSCRPNVRKARRGRLWSFWVDDAAAVAAGQELCITYLGGDERDLTVAERRQRLQDEWGFRCACVRCVEEGGV